MGKYTVSTPQSSAGLLSFAGSTGAGGLQIPPKTILLVAVGIIILISLLRVIIS